MGQPTLDLFTLYGPLGLMAGILFFLLMKSQQDNRYAFGLLEKEREEMKQVALRVTDALRESTAAMVSIAAALDKAVERMMK